jgi:hypothetical protein
MNNFFGFLAVLVSLILSSGVSAKVKSSALDDIGPAGGTVFFDKGTITNGWRYLEAAPSESSNLSSWGNVKTIFVGSTKVDVGEGKKNTEVILLKSSNSSAAKTCDDLVIQRNDNTFDDYFLPSKDELRQMYLAFKNNGRGRLPYNYYWSSSEYEYDEAQAWIQSFGSNGYEDYHGDKRMSLGVRCVRAFK